MLRKQMLAGKISKVGPWVAKKAVATAHKYHETQASNCDSLLKKLSDARDGIVTGKLPQPGKKQLTNLNKASIAVGTAAIGLGLFDVVSGLTGKGHRLMTTLGVIFTGVGAGNIALGLRPTKAMMDVNAVRNVLKARIFLAPKGKELTAAQIKSNEEVFNALVANVQGVRTFHAEKQGLLQKYLGIETG